MKRIFFSLSGIAIIALLFAFNNSNQTGYTTVTNDVSFEIPKEILTVINNKCYGCHNTKSKGEKSKKKLNWDNFTNNEYNSVKIYTKLGKIEKILGEDKMPPAKFLEKYPKKTLTEEEKQLILAWAKEQKITLQSK